MSFFLTFTDSLQYELIEKHRFFFLMDRQGYLAPKMFTCTVMHGSWLLYMGAPPKILTNVSCSQSSTYYLAQMWTIYIFAFLTEILYDVPTYYFLLYLRYRHLWVLPWYGHLGPSSRLMPPQLLAKIAPRGVCSSQMLRCHMVTVSTPTIRVFFPSSILFSDIYLFLIPFSW